MTRPLAAIVMAAGLGTRMKSRTPKHLHPILGRRMVDWVIEAVRPLAPQPLVVVTSPEQRDAFDAGVTVAVQEQPRGTGDAVAAARAALDGVDGDVLVLAGDSPLVTTALLEGLLERHREAGADATVTTFEPSLELPYGRVIRGDEGEIRAIVEERDATPEQRAITELSGSIYAFSAGALWNAVEALSSDNAQGELYLTDAVSNVGRVVAYESPDVWAPVGVNTRDDLASVTHILRERINERHMLAGVTIVDPYSTWIDVDVELEPDCVIHPFTVLRGRSRIAAGAEVRSFVEIFDAAVGPGALVGPHCYLRPGTVLEAGAKAGTFVEIKNSHVGAGAKVPHLSYLGDADVGEDTNVAAGNITANVLHDDPAKQRTQIGRDVKTGIHTSFVAPVRIGNGAWIAPGSVITEDVPPDSLAGFPPRQVTKEGYLRGKRDD